MSNRGTAVLWEAIKGLRRETMESKRVAKEARDIAAKYQDTRFQNHNEFNSRIDTIVNNTVTREEFKQDSRANVGKVDVLETKVNDLRQQLVARLTVIESKALGATENKEDSRSVLTSVNGWVVAAFAGITLLVHYFDKPASPQVVYVPSPTQQQSFIPPQGQMLVPSTQTPTK